MPRTLVNRLKKKDNSYFIPNFYAMNVENANAQMRKGVLELCILSILSRGDAYTTDLINKLKEDQMIVVEGTLYPLLTRQKNAGLLSYRWEESPQGPPRKYYSLTPKGKDYLSELEQGWDNLVDKVNSIRSQS
jgi:PadR family transcriptional regulator PadR